MAEVPALPRDLPLLILTGFIKCSVPGFVGPFELILNTERVVQLDNDGDRHDNRKFLERGKEITLWDINSFHTLKFSYQWNFPSNHQQEMAKGKGSCDNYGGK